MYWLFNNVFITKVLASILGVIIIIHSNNNMISVCRNANDNETIRCGDSLKLMVLILP
jgi:hypothetical protein